MDPVEDFLEHFGVKGMRWGVRRKRGPNGLVSADAAATREFRERAKKGGPDALSTDELQRLVTRMNLEQQYGRLQPKSKTATLGKKFVGDILGNVAKQQVSKVANDAAGKQIAKMLANQR